jgi:flagellar assembly factor FliW
MTVETKPFGTIDIDERQRLLFPFGLFGFEALRDFALLDSAQPPFYWLQSLEEPEIAFVLIEPAFFRPDYSPEIPRDDLEEIGISGVHESIVFAVVTIPDDQSRMSANLQGPILINRRGHIGRQSISINPNWHVKHYILDELRVVRERAC